MTKPLTFPRPGGKPAFTAPWFRWFFTQLTVPEGHPIRWEGHLLLMTEEFFRPELMHLLVIVPKGNGKTVWEAALGVWHLLTVKAPRVYCGAADLEQAKELYSFAQHFVSSEPEIASRLLVRESTREIRAVGGGLKVLASDDSKQGGKKQGKNPTLGLVDEEHAHENDNLKVDITSGGFKRRDNARAALDPLWFAIGKDVSITTAGHDPEGPLGQSRAKFMGDAKRGIPPIGSVETGLRVLPDGSVEKHPDGRLTICRSPTGGSVMLEWACRYDSNDPEGSDDLDDMEVVKFANPASSITPTSLADAKELLSPGKFKRYRANVWTVGVESWMPESAWPTLADPEVPKTVWRTWEGATWTGERDESGNAILTALTDEFRAFVDSLYPPGTSLVGAIDMARYRDNAAVVLIGRDQRGVKIPRAIVWKSGGQDNPIAYEWPKVAVLAVHERYQLRAFGYDPKYWDQSATEMLALGVPVEKWPQSRERIGPADTELRAEILSKETRHFAHDGDPTLTAHIQSGRSIDIGPQTIMVVQQDVANPPPIDACKALSMANALEKVAEEGDYLMTFPEKPPE